MSEYAKTDSSAPDAAPEPMSEEEVQSTLTKMIEDAEDFNLRVISPQREKAAEYYNGAPFGNEEEGRSKVVLTEVRDVVTSVMPSMMRVFWGPERRVEFLPTSARDVRQAEQETDYINDVVMIADNQGFLNTYTWFKDAFIKTTGVVKWWWDDTSRTTTHRLENMSEEQLSLLLLEDGVKLVNANPHVDLIDGVHQQLYDVEITRTAPDGRARWMPIPPEEFGFNRGARSMETADIVYHHSLKTTTELLELGIAQADIDEFGGYSSNLLMNPETLQRDPGLQTPADVTTQKAITRYEGGASPMDRHDYWETYPFLDANGDGKAELRKVCLIGPGKHVVENIPAEERPFAFLVPDPEPHTMLGLSLYDYIGDLQLISSMIFRGILDSLTTHLNPRYEVVEDKVSIPDVLNHQLGQPIRVKEANVVRPLTIDFVGANALPIMEFVKQVREERVGVMRAPGLDADALQSMDKGAANAVVTAAQQRLELFARIFAETGFSQLMKGLRRLVIRHQPRARMVKLRGEYVEIDPRTWDADRDVTTNVALGLGFTDQKIATLGAIAADQKDWLLKLGPTNPMVTLGQYRATMAKVLKLQGYPDAGEFYLPLDINFQPPPAPQSDQPDPALIVAQTEVQKANAEIQKMAMDAQLKQQEAIQRAQQAYEERQQALAIAQMENQQKRDALAADIELRRYELELKYNADLRGNEVEAAIDREREQLKRQTAIDVAQIKADSEVDKAHAVESEKAKAKAAEPQPAAPAAPNVTVHMPKQEAPHVEVHIPAPPAASPKKRKRVATAKKNKDGSTTITSEEIE